MSDFNRIVSLTEKLTKLHADLLTSQAEALMLREATRKIAYDLDDNYCRTVARETFHKTPQTDKLARLIEATEKLRLADEACEMEDDDTTVDEFNDNMINFMDAQKEVMVAIKEYKS